jgi:hypothetical protein
MPTNNYGPWYTTASGGGSGAVSNPSLQTPPQSPSGSVTGESATFNYAETITSTAQFLQNEQDVEIGAQQGTNASSNVAAISASISGVNPASVAVNNWTA